MLIPILAATGGVLVGSLIGSAVATVQMSAQMSDDDLIRIGEGQYVPRAKVQIEALGQGLKKISSVDKEVPWAILVPPVVKAPAKLKGPEVVAVSA